MTKTRMGEILDKYVKLLTLNCKKKINYYTEDKKISTRDTLNTEIRYSH